MDCNATNLVTIISQLQYELDVAKRRLQVEKSEKEQALTRLSSIAGSKLAYNNPGITDLSDKNRPQKLGEKFSEVYDNEWTDAIDSLTETMDEEKAILMLRDVLRYVYEKTKKASEEQYRNLQMALFQRDLRNSEAQSFVQIYRKITELQKEVSALSISNTKQFLRDDTGFMLPYEIVVKCCEPFIEKCVELCWMMHIQDPPMVLDFGSSEIVDKNAFRLFTRSGDVVDFFVWPAVLLHENGPLVQKGVVQPKKSQSKAREKDR